MTFQDVETARKTYKDKVRRGLLISVAVLAISFTFFFALGPIMGMLFLVLAVSTPVFTIAVTNQDRIAYRKAYKGYFVEQNLKKIFTHVIYDHEKGFSPAVIRESGMMRLADMFYSNDLTIAKYGKIPFAQADVAITRVYTDNKGNTHEYPVFKGRYMIFEFPKKFDYRLEVVGKKFKLYQVPKRAKNHEMERIETESTDFNHNFRVYGDDGFESFYLLAPDVIAKIEDIAKRYNYKLLLGFYNNKLIVALDDGKDAFEPPKFTKPINEKQEMAKVRDDIKVITDFVDVISPHSMV